MSNHFKYIQQCILIVGPLPISPAVRLSWTGYMLFLNLRIIVLNKNHQQVEHLFLGLDCLHPFIICFLTVTDLPAWPFSVGCGHTRLHWAFKCYSSSLLCLLRRQCQKSQLFTLRFKINGRGGGDVERGLQAFK